MEGGQRTFGDLNPFDRFHGDVFRPEKSCKIWTKTDLHTINHDAHDASPSAQAATHAAHGKRWGDEIIDHVEPRHVGQRLDEGSVSAMLDLFSRYDEDIR
jgi:hypothetical protein